MTDIFYSINAYGTGDLKTGSPNISITSGGVATLSVSQTGNIGIGYAIEYNSTVCYISRVNSGTSFNVITAIGGTPADQSSTSVTSIHAIWADLADAESNYLGASFLNTTDLVTAQYTCYFCVYYDQADYTELDGVTFYGATVNTTYRVVIYAPTASTESVNNQRATTGAWNTQKALIEIQDGNRISVRDASLKINGLQIDKVGAGGIIYTGDTGTTEIENTYLRNSSETSEYIWQANANNPNIIAKNTVFYNVTNNMALIRFYGESTITLQCCTFYGGTDRGIWCSGASGGAITNCIVVNSTDNFYGDYTGVTVSYCASTDGDGTNAVTLASDYYDDVFTDNTTGDFGLKNYSGTGAVIGYGTHVLDYDRLGVSRGSGACDIGAYEYAGGTSYFGILKRYDSSTSTWVKANLKRYDSTTSAWVATTLKVYSASTWNLIDTSG